MRTKRRPVKWHPAFRLQTVSVIGWFYLPKCWRIIIVINSFVLSGWHEFVLMTCGHYNIRRLHHWNWNVIILMIFSWPAAFEVVILTTSSAANNENFFKMIFLFQWPLPFWCAIKYLCHLHRVIETTRCKWCSLSKSTVWDHSWYIRTHFYAIWKHLCPGHFLWYRIGVFQPTAAQLSNKSCACSHWIKKTL